MKIPRELLKGVTDYLLLSLIESSPRHGYQMMKEIGRRSGGYFEIHGGTLYPALHRLEAQGLIVGWWERVSERQQRKYYQITERGRQVLQAKQDEWRDFSSMMDKLLAGGKWAR